MPLRPLTEDDLKRWVAEGWITNEQASRIVGRLGSPEGPSGSEGAKGLNVLTIAYYFGALLIVGALAWFLGDQWDALGASGILGVSTAYAALFFFVGYVLRFRMGYPIGGGILFTCGVWMVPLMTYAAERWLGYWPINDPGRYHGYYLWINGSWIVMEWATILVGFVVLRSVRFTFVTFPIAFALWFFSMDVAGLVMREANLPSEVRSWCSVVVGTGMLVVALLLDRRFEEDFSFWIYLYGLLAFWGGLSSLPSHGELGKFVYFSVNLSLAMAGLLVLRTAFLVFATMGVMYYLEHLAEQVFKGSVLFPFVVAFLGLALILGAVYLQRHRQRIDAALDRYRPARLRLG